MTKYNRTKVSVILYAVIAFVLAILIVGNSFAISYRTFISKALNQRTWDFAENTASDEEAEYFKSNYTDINKLIADETEYAKRVQEEGVVLLKNNGLPLSGTESVTLLGKYSKDDTYRNSGSGSGSADTSRAKTIRQTMIDAGYTLNTDVLAFYDGINSTTPEPAASALPAFNTNVGIVFISRGGGESVDVGIDTLKLTNEEKSLIDASLANCDKTVVLLNTFNPMELGYLDDKNVSVLWVGAAGEIGFGVIPEILSGKINPSGKLVDTYAYDVKSSPATLNQGDFTLTNVDATSIGNKWLNYAESIYYGYRYYETRYADVVTKRANVGEFNYASQIQWPFGYGLSYTTFAYSDFTVTENADTITLSVKVTNTGDVAGKEAVQFYMQSPYTDYDITNKVEKSAVELVGFDKTATLQKGASETVTTEVSKSVLAAYDYTKAKTYIVDAGDYYFAAGANSHEALNNILAAQGFKVADGMDKDGNAQLADKLTKTFDDQTYATTKQTGNKITNAFDEANLGYYITNNVYLTRNNWTGTFPKQATDIEATEQWKSDLGYKINKVADIANDKDVEMPTTGADNGLTLAMFIGKDYDDEAWDDLLDQLTPEEMMNLFAVGGYGTLELKSVTKPSTTDADGPAGISGSVMGGISLFAHPTEMLLASTWNTELADEMGKFIAEDGLMSGVTGWYAPGVNIHRTPNGGRNFEYYSEDPVQSGMFAAAVTKSTQERGIVVYVKHFALNEQETNRSTVCTFATEQAIREIYLKPFEICLVDGQAKGVMNSMNRIGAVWAGAHAGMQINVLRNEWGSHAITITDATLNTSAKMQALPTLLGGTDLFLCTNFGIFEIADYATSATTMTALRESAHRVLYAFANSNAMNGFTSDMRIVTIMPAWQICMVVADVVIGLAAVVAVYFITRNLIVNNKKEAK